MDTAAEVEVMSPSDKAVVHRPRRITVEPVLFLLFFVQAGMITLRSQYTEHRLAQRYNYTLPGDNATTCANTSTKDPMQVKIETETATWSMYMESMSTLPPMATALVLGTLSDFTGRRPMLIVGATGHMIAATVCFLVAYFNWPLAVLLGGEAVLGVCGDTALLTAVSFSYVADITAEHAQRQRSFRFVVNDLMTHLGLGVSFLSINVALQKTNNYWLVYAILLVPALLALLYVTLPCIIRETVQRRPVSCSIFKDLLLSIFRLFRNNVNGRRWKLLLLLLCQFLYDSVYESLFGVITIYGLGAPFCWPHTVVGMFGVINSISPAIGSVFGIKLLSPYMSEFSLVIVGFMSGIGLLLSTAIATTNAFLVYVAPALGLLRVLSTSVLKSLMSKTVSKEEQGALFGCVAVIVSIARSVSPFFLNEVYSVMVRIHLPALTFCVAIGVLVIAILLVTLIQSWQYWQPRAGYASLQGEDRAVRCN
ncbi:proton-coupled folate transporter-like [Acanthaster planci]|uniref:Proton-coupled folate transporter n=1 Tax=Acanthaster planci TaxID=133434 RepID=A0A8B7Z1K8_ACAPL|nr:proton-coupled folate transporter-like [Acanthaster planci]XP_022099484.1 proton-coupled folate transporter-like [Acanthaster planci]XP_022099485.1 proton-coupled folate transporter-like [Acanthaster planci]XP_022099486.1 proton-coupled folate transporter-like [Acanthaster planci]